MDNPAAAHDLPDALRVPLIVYSETCDLCGFVADTLHGLGNHFSRAHVEEYHLRLHLIVTWLGVPANPHRLRSLASHREKSNEPIEVWYRRICSVAGVYSHDAPLQKDDPCPIRCTYPRPHFLSGKCPLWVCDRCMTLELAYPTNETIIDRVYPRRKRRG